MDCLYQIFIQFLDICSRPTILDQSNRPIYMEQLSNNIINENDNLKPIKTTDSRIISKPFGQFK